MEMNVIKEENHFWKNQFIFISKAIYFHLGKGTQGTVIQDPILFIVQTEGCKRLKVQPGSGQSSRKQAGCGPGLTEED